MDVYTADNGKRGVIDWLCVSMILMLGAYFGKVLNAFKRDMRKDETP